LIRRGCGLGEGVADLRFELGVKSSAAEAEVVLVVYWAHAQLLKLQKMSLQKEKAHKLTVKAARKLTVKAAINGRHERNRVRVTVIIISTVVTYLVSSSFI
jgi:hypothetical protein